MDSPAANAPREPERSFVEWLRDMPRWKQIALALGLGTAVVGSVWSLSHGGPTGGQSGLSTQLHATSAPATDEPTSKGVFRLGFSFLAGFCIGSFIRAALRLVAIAVGFWLLMTVLLSYFDLVVVDWHAIEGVWDRFAANVEREWSSFSTFLTGSLPAAGLAVGGLAIGLKRH